MKIGIFFGEKKKQIKYENGQRTGNNTKNVVFFALSVNSCYKSNIRNGNPCIFVVNEKWLWLKSIVGVSLSILCYVLCSNMQNYSIWLSIPIPFFLFNFFFCCPFHNEFLRVYCIDYLAPAWKCFVINNAILMMRKGKTKRKCDALMECGTFQTFFFVFIWGNRPSNKSEQCKIRIVCASKTSFFLYFLRYVNKSGIR